MTKISQGGTAYDVTVPSEYAISKMKEEEMLLPLDHEKIPNLQYIDPRFLDLSFDPKNEYSIPYFWGTFGIIYKLFIISENVRWSDINKLGGLMEP